MSARVQLYEECQLWPIGVTLAGRTRYTLWGSAGAEDDRILADRRVFLLFTSLARMSAFLVRPARTSLSGRPGLARLRRRLREQSGLPGVEIVYPLAEVHAALARFDPDRLRRRECKAIVDTLNLLWDVAENRDDARARALLRDRAPLARLLDVLTFHDPAKASPPARLRALRPADLAEAYATLVGTFVLTSRIVA